jgi:hypothetical protein
MVRAALEAATNDVAGVDTKKRHYRTFSTIAKRTLLLLHVGITPCSTGW